MDSVHLFFLENQFYFIFSTSVLVSFFLFWLFSAPNDHRKPLCPADWGCAFLYTIRKAICREKLIEWFSWNLTKKHSARGSEKFQCILRRGQTAVWSNCEPCFVKPDRDKWSSTSGAHTNMPHTRTHKPKCFKICTFHRPVVCSDVSLNQFWYLRQIKEQRSRERENGESCFQNIRQKNTSRTNMTTTCQKFILTI